MREKRLGFYEKIWVDAPSHSLHHLLIAWPADVDRKFLASLLRSNNSLGGVIIEKRMLIRKSLTHVQRGIGTMVGSFLTPEEDYEQHNYL